MQLYSKTISLVATMLAFFSMGPIALADQACPPAGYTNERLIQLKESGFALEDDAARNQLAVSLTACLSDPDPEIRDGVAFEGLSQWLREAQLTENTRQMLLDISRRQLAGETDEGGFLKPFAALLLAEVSRTDRIDPWISGEQRLDVVEAAARYMSDISDYRGFSENQGWRHGVAHASDLVLQLALNEAIDASMLQKLLDATAVQIAPSGTHFYVYGEPGRLARAVFYAWRRGIIEEEYWSRWFERVASSEPLESWGDSFSSQAGLAQRHNTLNFLMALHLNAVFAEDEALAQRVMNTITTILGG